MRRIHIPALSHGKVQLPASEAHHVRDVLRLTEGMPVQAFDDAGNTADAMIARMTGQSVEITIERINPPANSPFRLTIASAVPKAARADWMIEKLCELGVDEFVPLVTARSVSLPEGEGKLGRWGRIATEAAKQSRRQGLMQISPLMNLGDLLSRHTPQNPIWCLSLDDDARPLPELAARSLTSLTLLIGPEGGWTDQELSRFKEMSLVFARLTSTVLRIETAAIAAAAIVVTAATPSQLAQR